jgi:uncharacterized protein YjbJ (UPF0337 family)
MSVLRNAVVQTNEESIMNSDIAEGKWRQIKGSVKEKWGKLTDDDLQEVNGRFEKFCGKMQQRYGMSREEAENEFDRYRE